MDSPAVLGGFKLEKMLLKANYASQKFIFVSQGKRHLFTFTCSAGKLVSSLELSAHAYSIRLYGNI